jgi:hypothetical protein
VRLDGPGDTAGRVFGAAAFGIIEGFGVIVEVFFGPGRFELPFAGPLDAVPAGAVKVLAYQEPDRACVDMWEPFRLSLSKPGAVDLYWLSPAGRTFVWNFR